MPAIGKSALFWLTLGWIGFAVLPWYFEDALISGPAISGLVLAIADGRLWLLPRACRCFWGLFRCCGRTAALQRPAGSSQSA